MISETSCFLKDSNETEKNVDKISKLLSSIEKGSLEIDSMTREANQVTREIYSSLCEYLKLNLSDDEDPLKRIEDEKSTMMEKIANMKGELSRLDESKEDWKAKLCIKKSELRKIEEMRDDPDLGIDSKTKNSFKVLSKFLNVTYKIDQDSQATAAAFKNINKQIRFDDLTRSKQQKMSEFWRILEHIDRKDS